MKTGIHFERCNSGTAELHNTRDKAYMDAVNISPNKKYSIYEDRTHLNACWKSNFLDKSLPEYLDDLRKLVKEKTGRAMQEKDHIRTMKDKKTGRVIRKVVAGSSPIREGVFPIKEDTKIKDLQPVVDWLHSKGIRTLAIYLHLDEGHTDERTGERKYNRHGHIICDWMNHTTGRSAKLDKSDMRELQTVLARALGMERGVAAEITNAQHLSPDEERAQKAAQQAALLEQEVQNYRERLERLKNALKSAESPWAMYMFLQQCCKKALQQLTTAINKDGWEGEVIAAVTKKGVNGNYTKMTVAHDNDTYSLTVGWITGITRIETKYSDYPSSSTARALRSELTPTAMTLLSSAFFSAEKRNIQKQAKESTSKGIHR